MTQLNLDDDVVRRIEELAKRENRSTSAMMRTLLEQYGSPSETESDDGRTWLHDMALLADSDGDAVG